MRIQRLASSLLKTKWNCADTVSTSVRPSCRALSNAVRSEASSKPLPDLERVLQQANKIVCNSTNSNHNLQHLLNEEVSVVTQILHRLVGTNNPLSEIEK